MGYSSRKTSLQLPGGILLPVNIMGVQDTAPVVNNFCVNHDTPVAVASTVACPTCANTDRATWKRGIKQGKADPIMLPDEDAANPKIAADHSVSQLTAHNREEVDEISMVVGKTYAITPQKGTEMLYSNLHEWILDNPKIALVTVWGWTAAKSQIWVLEASMGKILLRELAHPNDVRDIPAPADLANAAMVGMLSMILQPEKFDVDTYQDHNAAAKAAAKGSGDTNVSADALMASLMAAAETVAPKKATRKKAA